MNIQKIFIILAHSLIGWAFCTASMVIGMTIMPLKSALIVHAIGAPIFFTVISVAYFSKFAYTQPLPTALIFVSFVIFVDFFVVSLMINRSLDMFASMLGTWIPFALIFLSTFVTGLLTFKRHEHFSRD